MLNITNHQGNVTQIHYEISPRTSLMAIINKTTNNKCGKGCGGGWRTSIGTWLSAGFVGEGPVFAYSVSFLTSQSGC